MEIMAKSCSLDNTLTVKLQTLDDKTRFAATARENPEIFIDYFPPVGTGNGYTSLEIFMISFGSCISSTLMTLLRYRMKKPVSGVTVVVNGRVREEHPRALEYILLTMKIKANDLSEAEVQAALKLAEDTMCPVWAMIKGNVTVEVKTEICE